MEETKFKFPSEEWLARFVEELNKNQEYRAAAKDWEGDMILVVNAGPGVEKEWAGYVDLWHGECRSWSVLPDRHAKKAEFLIEGPLDSWIKLIKGELDPVKAMLGRKIKIDGSMMRIMRNVNASTEFTKNSRRVPTLFPPG
ncbi:MAG: SCP2 sterol-binding domain-containing protein [Methanomassiliicoccales archaeon]|nr:SCP2 sterol-binding domain-containing protein [Methanomassiliicoccales archaeon]